MSVGKSSGSLVVFLKPRGEPEEEFYEDSEEEAEYCEDLIFLNKIKKIDNDKE